MFDFTHDSVLDRDAFLEELRNCDCVVVLWSRVSKYSRWIQEDVEIGLNRKSVLIVDLVGTFEDPDSSAQYQFLHECGIEARPFRSGILPALQAAVSAELGADGRIVAPLIPGVGFREGSERVVRSGATKIDGTGPSSKFDELRPGKYFLSHSYEDTSVAAQLKSTLPERVEPYVFPAIEVSPLEFVSNTLIGAIIACDALIYVRGGPSDHSFWVSFEREFALKLAKPVYEYRKSRRQITPIVRSPINPKVFYSAALEDYHRLDHLRRFMSEHRNFEILLPHNIISGREVHEGISRLFRPAAKLSQAQLEEAYKQQAKATKSLELVWSHERRQVEDLIRSCLLDSSASSKGVLVFWSENSLNSKFQNDDLRMVEEIYSEVTRFDAAQQKAQFRNERKQGVAQRALSNILRERLLFARLDETPLPAYAENSIQLYGDDERSEINRIDDLIVSLYWHFGGAVHGL
ncbi:MAG: hypothetical protein KDA53_08755 [Hyphomonas sp.]|nr:hypothetical protein [Hyphomonas sp.]